MFSKFILSYKMSEDVIVFENIGDNPITFETKEDFIRYYTKNKTTIDQIKTRGLNRKFKIDGFKIGRQKGTIVLFPQAKNNDQVKNENEEYFSTTQSTEETDLLNTKIDIINQKLQKIELMIKEILDNL